MSDDGSCNLSFVYDFFENVPKGSTAIFILKSTVPIGTTEYLQKTLRKDLRIVHNPEFLTADNAEGDFHRSERNVIGGNINDCEEVRNLLYEVFPEWESVPCIICSSKQSEIIKYFSNCFLAMKVAYFNSVYETCSKYEVNYEIVKDGIAFDSRIGNSHTTVPGGDGKLGFGGYCFPKDINALIKTMKENDLDCSILESVWNYNLKIRGNEL
jgi:UDPglucose 6-dehydrogenase